MLTDAIKNTSKNIDKFVCVICDFTCSKKGDYNRHLTTRKHIKLTDKLTTDANGITSDKYFCNYCGSFFSHKSSLSRHKKKCISIKNDNNDSEKEVKMKDTVSMEQFVDVVNKCVQLSEDNKVLTEKVVELAKEPKVVNNTQNINNNVFNLNVFLNENCKDALNLTDFVQNLKLQLEDLENMGKLGYVEGMSKIIIKGLEELDIEKRPNHCTDVKRDVLYIKDNDTWERNETMANEKLTTTLEDIKKKNVVQMKEWVEKYPQVRNANSERADEYHKIVSNMFGCNGDEEKDKTKIMKNIAKHTKIDKGDVMKKDDNN